MRLLFIVILCAMTGACMAQAEQTTIKKRLEFASVSNENLLMVQNINGNVTIVGHDKSTVEISVERTISASSAAAKKKGHEEVQLGVIEKDQVMVLFMDNPCTNSSIYQLSSEQLRAGKFNQWINNCDWQTSYDYRMDWTIKVPKNTQIVGSTINEGYLKIQNVDNYVDANNINGDITLKDLSGTTKVNAINGDVLIHYRKNPQSSCKYYSLNGDIKVQYEKGIAAKVYFESFSGDLYTEIDDVSTMPTEVRQEKSNKGKGIKYKLSGNPGVQVRDGDLELYFETFNGDVYLSEQ
ncbi:MAG: hypothetical protein AAF798_09450 [Bacteroidota bacterium]